MQSRSDVRPLRASSNPKSVRAPKRCSFRQGDVTRAIKGAKAAGFEPGPVQIRPDGTIVILPIDAGKAECSLDNLDRWETEYRARKA